jgi:hypothetical protein
MWKKTLQEQYQYGMISLEERNQQLFRLLDDVMFAQLGNGDEHLGLRINIGNVLDVFHVIGEPK